MHQIGTDASPASPEGSQRRGVRGLSGSAIALAVLVVFFAHFRPWQGGLLEEWGYEPVWDAFGWAGFTDRLGDWVGRPLHLLPTFVGLAISDGGFVGLYLVLALVAVGQLVTIGWGLRHVITSPVVRWSAGLLLALHPWWEAGGILRFLPAQVAVLCVAIWFVAAARYLGGGSRWWVAGVVLAPAAGLLCYQAPAGTFLVGAVLLSARILAPLRRRVVTIAATTGVVGAVLVWSAIVAPRIAPGTYESQFLAAPVGPHHAVRVIARTLLSGAPLTVAVGLAVGVAVVVLGLRRVLRLRDAALLIGGLAAAPLTALIYSAELGHLLDPERVAGITGTTVLVVLLCLLVTLPVATWAARGFAAVAVLISLVGAVAAYSAWTEYAIAQRDLLDLAAPVRAALSTEDRLVLVDRSGRYGDYYLFLDPYVDFAFNSDQGRGPQVVLCTADGVARDHAVAARLGAVLTQECSAVLAPGAERLARLETVLGPVDAYRDVPAP